VLTTIAINHSHKLVVTFSMMCIHQTLVAYCISAGPSELLTHGFHIAFSCLQLYAEFLTKILGLLVDHCHDALQVLF
jgi:hypothetical protein